VTELSLFRVYEPHELGPDGYPHVWHAGVDYELVEWDDGALVEVVVTSVDLAGSAGTGVKHLVRERAGNRCARCGHPFVVGESGVMEGPHAEQKAFAAGMGMSVEDADQALTMFVEDLTPEVLEQARRVNWSPCDERCTHRGPYRYRPPQGKRLPGEKDWSYVGKDEDCNSPQQLWKLAPAAEVEAAWRILTVHHLNGRKHDLRWWNLIAVCQRCHLWLQRRVIMERVYPFEHDDYFKPHAAGWYAYAYLGENLTEEETMDRLDELLELERMA